MKKDRNCTMAIYPNMVPNYGGMIMSDQMMPMPGGYNTGVIPTNTQNNFGTDLNSITNQINSLEQRVSRLENVVNGTGYSTNYNSNNYQMM